MEFSSSAFTPLITISGWGCLFILSRWWKNGLDATKITLWASNCWPSSQAKVTSEKSLSPSRFPKAVATFSWKSFHFRHSFSDIFKFRECLNAPGGKICNWNRDLLKRWRRRTKLFIMLLFCLFVCVRLRAIIRRPLWRLFNGPMWHVACGIMWGGHLYKKNHAAMDSFHVGVHSFVIFLWHRWTPLPRVFSFDCANWPKEHFSRHTNKVHSVPGFGFIV